MATENDLRELFLHLEDGAPTVNSTLEALNGDRPPLDRRLAPPTRHWRGWRVAGAAAACTAVIAGAAVLTHVVHRQETNSAADGTGRLSTGHRALALAAAHQVANQAAVGRDRPLISGWPDGISAVTAVAQPGIVTAAEANTGHSCTSGTIIVVRLAGAFDVVTAGNLDSPNASSTVRELDLSVDATTGLTCLSSARTEPAPPSRNSDVLYRR